MIQGLRELWGKIQYNIKRVMDSDPAATNVWMVIWTYPHITALFWHFFAHRLYKAGWPTLARRVALHSRHVTGIEIIQVLPSVVVYLSTMAWVSLSVKRQS